jgi:hypothetical protein
MLAALCLTVIAPPAYTNLKLDGFTLVVESRLIKSRAQTWAAVRTELHRQLLGINRVIPKPALQKLNQVPIYIHNTSPETRCMAYHPGAQWLREHKMNPEMEKAIEIGSADNFLSWTQQQPWMVLHELAHAYHDRFLPRGFENPDLAAAHKRGLESKKYDAVLHWDGKTTSHYAKNNPMEFFAEASEAYFGQNDFYPFVNAELKTHDPETFALIAKVWGVTN